MLKVVKERPSSLSLDDKRKEDVCNGNLISFPLGILENALRGLHISDVRRPQFLRIFTPSLLHV